MIVPVGSVKKAVAQADFKNASVFGSDLFQKFAFRASEEDMDGVSQVQPAPDEQQQVMEEALGPGSQSPSISEPFRQQDQNQYNVAKMYGVEFDQGLAQQVGQGLGQGVPLKQMINEFVVKSLQDKFPGLNGINVRVDTSNVSGVEVYMNALPGQTPENLDGGLVAEAAAFFLATNGVIQGPMEFGSTTEQSEALFEAYVKAGKSEEDVGPEVKKPGKGSK